MSNFVECLDIFSRTSFGHTLALRADGSSWDRHQVEQAISLGLKPALPRSDLNLKEVQLLWPGWPDLSPHFLFETLAEVDFYSYRPRDLTLQASQAASLSRGAGSQYHGQNKLHSADEELLRSNI